MCRGWDLLEVLYKVRDGDMGAEAFDWIRVATFADGRRWRAIRVSGETLAVDDSLPEFRNGDALQRIALKDPSENGIQLGREGQNRLQELGILEIGPEGCVLGRCSLPWVAATGEVDEDDTQRPDIVGCREIARIAFRRGLLAFYPSLVSG